MHRKPTNSEVLPRSKREWYAIIGTGWLLTYFAVVMGGYTTMAVRPDIFSSGFRNVLLGYALTGWIIPHHFYNKWFERSRDR